MFQALGATLYRDRRRLLFVAAAAFLAGYLFYLPAALASGLWYLPAVAGAVYALVVGLVAWTICAIFPAMRFMIEAVAVSRLVLSVCFLAAPQVGIAVLANPLLTAALVVLGGMAVSRLLHGRILRDRRPGWRALLGPANLFHRMPARLNARPWQHRFVGWLDDAVPIPV